LRKPNKRCFCPFPETLVTPIKTVPTSATDLYFHISVSGEVADPRELNRIGRTAHCQMNSKTDLCQEKKKTFQSLECQDTGSIWHRSPHLSRAIAVIPALQSSSWFVKKRPGLRLSGSSYVPKLDLHRTQAPPLSPQNR
jgi:hypothetical protein